MIGDPYGYMKEIGAEWNLFSDATLNCVVIQQEPMSGPASMRFENGKWEIELGT